MHQFEPINSELLSIWEDMIAKCKNSRGSYDCVVLFTGGKDSAYLAHLMKYWFSNRVCLLTIENGFEKSDFLEKAGKSADQLGCDWYVFQPPQRTFLNFYRFLITEKSLSEIDTNPLCFLCGRYFMSQGAKFANNMGIPMVIYGATPEQINRGQVCQTKRELQIFNLVSRKFFKSAHQKIKMTEGYQKDSVVASMIDLICSSPEGASIVFPFQYFSYHIDNIKNTLEKEYDWQNPSGTFSNKEYLSSGCRLVDIFGFLSKNAGFGIHELEQFRKDYEKGILSKDAYNCNMNHFNKMLNDGISDSVKDVIFKLGLAEHFHMDTESVKVNE